MNNAYKLYQRCILLFAILLTVSEIQAMQDSVVTEKHIYDSSENFFNWREDIHEAYYIVSSDRNPQTPAKISLFKKHKEFWYVDAIEEIESRYILYAEKIDSLNNANRNRASQQPSNSSRRTGREKLVDEEVSVMMNGQNFFTTSVWVTILLLLLVLFGGFVFLNKDNVLLRKNREVQYNEKGASEENIFSISYVTAITNAEQLEDYAKAIRLRYLEIIKLMSEAAIISYQPDLTNMDYLAQLRRSKYLDDFITVTRHYEFSWYGKLSVSEAAYKKIRDDFARFKTILL